LRAAGGFFLAFCAFNRQENKLESRKKKMKLEDETGKVAFRTLTGRDFALKLSRLTKLHVNTKKIKVGK
jgi:hypothetical protein